MLNGYTTLLVAAVCRHCGSGDISYSFSYVILQDEFLVVCHHPSKFGGQKHCGSGDTMFTICRVISLDHVIKGWYAFLNKSFSRYVTFLTGLVPIGMWQWRYIVMVEGQDSTCSVTFDNNDPDENIFKESRFTETNYFLTQEVKLTISYNESNSFSQQYLNIQKNLLM